jgi:hypothetical protein
LAIALAAGSISSGPSNPPLVLGGYRVLAADFHTHPGFLAAGAIAPWDFGMLARRQGLDVVAVTPHNQIYSARIARWFSRMTGGPMMIIGEEIRTLPYHLIAVGIEKSITPRGRAAEVIDDIHAQGGIAIAAHPFPQFWPAFDEEAIKRLNGSEVMHPAVYINAGAFPAFLQFYERKKAMTAIGSSDYHGLGALGICRTFVFSRGASEQDVLDALRAGRTVVYDRTGGAHGNAELIRLAGQDGRLLGRGMAPQKSGLPGWISRICAISALLGFVVFGFDLSPASQNHRLQHPGHR